MYDVWKNVLAEIEQQISAANFSTWFQDTTLLSTDNGEVKIGVKNSFYVKQLRNRYLEIIKTALSNNNIPVSTIDFEVQSSTKSKVRSREVTMPDNIVNHRPDIRPLCREDTCRYRCGLLRRSWHRTRDVQAAARALQGLYLNAQSKPLSVAAQHNDRPRGYPL